jgi:hypothetical protein
MQAKKTTFLSCLFLIKKSKRIVLIYRFIFFKVNNNFTYVSTIEIREEKIVIIIQIIHDAQ